MNYFFIKDLITDKISGEWGLDPVSDKCVKVIRTTNFTNEGRINLSNVVEREVSETKVKQKKLKYGDKYTFAFDNIKDEKIIVEKLRNYLSWGQNWRLRLFIYCNADMSLSDVIYRIMFCKKNKIMPYLMRDKNCWLDLNQKDFSTDLAGFVNQPNIIKKLDFEEYLVKRHNQNNKELQKFYIDIRTYCNWHVYFKEWLDYHYKEKHLTKNSYNRILTSLKPWEDNYAEPNYLVWGKA